MEFTINIKSPIIPNRKAPEDFEQDLIDQANSFFQAGSRCVADIKLSPNITNSLPAPAVVCYSFAIELYLKLLLNIAKKPIKKRHSLTDLTSDLPEEIIELISKHYGQSKKDLKKSINSISDSFIKWRYLYEYHEIAISLTVLSNLCIALHNCVKELKPSLGITFENRLAI
jgi:hypothetical protein